MTSLVCFLLVAHFGAFPAQNSTHIIGKLDMVETDFENTVIVPNMDGNSGEKSIERLSLFKIVKP